MEKFKELLNVTEDIYCIKQIESFNFIYGKNNKNTLVNVKRECEFIGTKEECESLINNDQFNYSYGSCYYVMPSSIVFDANYLNNMFIKYNIDDDSFIKACEKLEDCLMNGYDKYVEYICDYKEYNQVLAQNEEILDIIKVIKETMKEYELYLSH